MKCYKLTDRYGYTRRGEENETLWGEGVTHTAKGTGGLCTDGVIHAYASPELALFINPSHADITDPLVWECDGEALVEDDGTKQGFRTLTTLHTIEVDAPTTEQCVTFAILCTKATGCADAVWNEWADRWLDGKDRSWAAADAAYAAAYAVRAAAWAAADAVAGAAVRTAAYAAAYAARAAAWAAADAAYAAWAAAYAAWAAAYAAAYAAYAHKSIDPVAIAKQAMEAQR